LLPSASLLWAWASFRPTSDRSPLLIPTYREYSVFTNIALSRNDTDIQPVAASPSPNQKPAPPGSSSSLTPRFQSSVSSSFASSSFPAPLSLAIRQSP
jgi:hypothetical protein